MKTKGLALVNGIVGLAGGIFLVLFLFFATALTAAAAQDGAGASVLIGTVIKIAALVLGIISLVYYKDDERVGSAGGILLIVGGSIGLIPFLGWIGGILLIIGGSLYLATLKKFKA